jgi:hypothetical protein
MQNKKLLQAVTIFSGLYTTIPLYAMLFGYMSPELAVTFVIPSGILLCVSLHLQK